jgi:hypothetical protein
LGDPHDPVGRAGVFAGAAAFTGFIFREARTGRGLPGCCAGPSAGPSFFRRLSTRAGRSGCLRWSPSDGDRFVFLFFIAISSLLVVLLHVVSTQRPP